MMGKAVWAALVAAGAVLGTGVARAEDTEAAALSLADAAPSEVASASDWRVFAEGGLGQARRRDKASTEFTRRVSVDIHYDRSLSEEWRAVFADRLDIAWPAQGDDHAINTLKEAYLGWRPRHDTLLDFGRINARHGVAAGYNPTDYFRRGAVRLLVSVNPASLKENRQGSVMLRAQRLWDSGSMTILYSPELSRGAEPSGLTPDWDATNDRNRWLIAVSQAVTETLRPQFLIYREEALPAQIGLNLTGLADDATVAYLEWSGGRSASLLDQALAPPGAAAARQAWRNRVSAGLTYTTPDKISLTAEFQYNGGGLDAGAWNALREESPLIYGLYRNRLHLLQEPPTRHGLFFYATWQDAAIHRLDLSAMHNIDTTDWSRRSWFEIRYHSDRIEYAWQWQRNSGGRLTHFGALPEIQGWQLSARYYF